MGWVEHVAHMGENGCCEGVDRIHLAQDRVQ